MRTAELVLPEPRVERERPAQEVVTARLAQIPTNQPPTLLAYLRAAESGADLDRLEKLMDLHNRWETNEARKAFEEAMSEFRKESMVILKTKYVDIAGGAKFWHAQLADACDAIIPNMSKYGLRHRWKTEQENNKIRVTCVISHKLGYSEPTVLEGPPDTGGNKSPIHAIASSVALLERYTLMAACGLASKDMDNNPKGTGTTDPEVKAPADFENWKADARALADEGSERLKDLWKRSPQDIRKYVVTYEMEWWKDVKAISEKVDKKAKEGAK